MINEQRIMYFDGMHGVMEIDNHKSMCDVRDKQFVYRLDSIVLMKIYRAHKFSFRLKLRDTFRRMAVNS